MFEVTLIFLMVFIDSFCVFSYVDNVDNMDSFIFIDKGPVKKITPQKVMALLCF
jgi:hypothetical protein